MVALALWSGGLDSTYMVQYLIDNPKSITESMVDTVYIKLLNNDRKTRGEQKAIENMIPFFQKYYDHKFSHSGAVAEISLMVGRPVFPLIQVPIWLFAAATAVQSHHTQVCIGYVMNDSALSYLEEIQHLWKAYNGLLRPGERLPELTFPIVKFPKEEIADRIYPELKEHLFWCENPNEETLEQCKIDCEPCKRSPIIKEQRRKEITELVNEIKVKADDTKATKTRSSVQKDKRNTRKRK